LLKRQVFKKQVSTRRKASSYKDKQQVQQAKHVPNLPVNERREPIIHERHSKADRNFGEGHHAHGHVFLELRINFTPQAFAPGK
jgi:hypothetical protein